MAGFGIGLELELGLGLGPGFSTMVSDHVRELQSSRGIGLKAVSHVALVLLA